MIALFSIKPEFVEKIFSGQKGYEYRRVIFKKEVKKIVVYCTKPVGMIVGEFEVEEIIKDSPSELWSKTRDSAGVHKKFYTEYFNGRKVGYAIKFGKKQLYQKAVDPSDVFENFRPPQSFRYLSTEDYMQCLTRAIFGASEH